MSRLEIKANELTDTDVSFVSLVKRGANRLPFRITKGDTEMLDLYAVGRRMFQKSDPVPTVVAVVTQKADAAVLKSLAAIFALGEKLAKSDEDGVVTLTKADAKVEGATFLRLSHDYGVLVKNASLQKNASGRSFDGTIFADVAGKDGYFVGPALAGDMYSAYAANVMKSELGAGKGAELAKAATDYGDYLGVLAGLPDTLLKAEAVLKACGSGNAAGVSATDQETGDGQGDAANGKAKKDGDGPDKGDPDADDPLMPGKNAATGTRAAKADAGKNGTGAGFEAGEGTGSTPRATDDDASNTEVDAKPGKRVSGDNSGLPAKAQASTTKDDAMASNDDSTNGAQSKLPAKLKSPTAKTDSAVEMFSGVMTAMGYVVKVDGSGGSHIITVTSVEPQGESAAGEGAAQAVDHRDSVSDEDVTGAAVTGKVKGATLSMDGVPAKLKAPTSKNDGDADIGKKGKGNSEPDEQSGAGAQEKDVQTLKADTASVMQAIQALAKSVKDSNAAVTKSVSDLSTQVESVTALARKTDAALNGTVFNEEDGDAARVQKRDDGYGGIPLMDTGYQRRSA